MPWYYLLPAILFLITFTLMPIGLTVFLAFTDYAGTRNTQLNPTTQVSIVEATGERVVVENVGSLQCAALHNGCEGVRVRLYASGQVQASGESLNGTTLTLEASLPEGQTVTAVGLTLTEFGIEAQFPVTATDGATLTLGRAPAR